jgi:hypothetical protein
LYLDQFHTNYIIFRNVEIFRNYFFQVKKYCEDTKEYSGIFHLLKWVFQNQLIIQRTCVEMAKVHTMVNNNPFNQELLVTWEVRVLGKKNGTCHHIMDGFIEFCSQSQYCTMLPLVFEFCGKCEYKLCQDPTHRAW